MTTAHDPRQSRREVTGDETERTSRSANAALEHKPEMDRTSPTVEESFAPNAGRTRLAQLNRRLAEM